MMPPFFLVRRQSAVLAIAAIALTACAGAGHSAAIGNNSVLPASSAVGTLKPLDYQQGGGDFTTFPEPGYYATSVTVGSDGGIWVGTDTGVLRVTNSGGVTRYAVNTTLDPCLNAGALTDAIYKADNARVWFDNSCQGPGSIGLVSDAGTVTAAPLGNDPNGRRRIAYGSLVEDATGTLWFAEGLLDLSGPNGPTYAVGEIRNAGAALIAAQSSGSLASAVQDIVVGTTQQAIGLSIGTNKRPWFLSQSDSGGAIIGTISGSGSTATVSSYPLPGISAGLCCNALLSYGGYFYATSPYGINVIKPGKGAPASTFYPLVNSSSQVLGGLAAGSNGSIYFPGYDGNDSQYTLFSFDPATTAFGSYNGTAATLAGADSVALGPDGNIWGTGNAPEYLPLSADIFVFPIHALLVAGLGSPPAAAFSLSGGPPSEAFTVTEPDPGGSTITVTSSDTTVVTVSPSGSQTNTGAPLSYTLTPVGAGDAVVKVVDQKNNFVHIPVSVTP